MQKFLAIELVAVVLLCSLNVCFAGDLRVYTWVDEHGRTHFGDRPHKPGTQAENDIVTPAALNVEPSINALKEDVQAPTATVTPKRPSAATAKAPVASTEALPREDDQSPVTATTTADSGTTSKSFATTSSALDSETVEPTPKTSDASASGATIAEETRALANITSFPVFDTSMYRNKPDLARFGIREIPIVYAAQIWVNSEKGAKLPTAAEMDDVVRRRIPTDSDFSVIDIETWPWNLRGDNSNSVAETVDKLYSVLLNFRVRRPNTKFGYYFVAPIRDYHCSLRPTTDQCYARWRDESNIIKKLVREVDVMMPSLYTLFDDPEDWKKFAIRHIEEARRLSPGKPVYPFIWPATRHINDGKFEYIDPAFWVTQLETVKEHADGVIIWGGFDQTTNQREDWNDTAPWWLETLKWMGGR